LLWILETIRQILNDFVHLQPSMFPTGLQNSFLETWNEVEYSLRDASNTIKASHANLIPQLQQAGMTGEMLALKSATLQRSINGLYGAIGTQPTTPTFFGRITKRFKPVGDCINSILGSLISVIPGLEIAKEYKEQVEVAVETTEAESPA
jgi:hypothetical protein